MDRLKLVMLPLDVRPCCYDFPAKLARIAGHELTVPPRSLLNPNFMEPSSYPIIVQWLKDQCSDADYLVLSIDMLVYGGLAASRRHLISVDQARHRMNLLSELKTANPRLRILAYSILIPLQPVVSDPKEAREAVLIARYCQLSGRPARVMTPEDRSELDDILRAIPRSFLEQYLVTRRRNHEINALAVEAVSDGLVDFVVLPQCDSSQYGLHVQEQADLISVARTRGVLDRILMYPGTDEVGMVLLARCLSEVHDYKLKLFVRHTSSNGDSLVAPFEDVPIGENIRLQLEAIRGIMVDTPAEADVVMVVNGPARSVETENYIEYLAGSGAQQHFVYRHRREIPEIWDIPSLVEYYLERQHRVAIADIALPNGADCDLLDLLSRRIRLSALTAFAAWNTAGNTIGTVLAHAMVRCFQSDHMMQDGAANMAHYQFLFERYVDDWLYQSEVRTDIERHLLEEMGISPLNISPVYDEIDCLVARTLSSKAHALFDRHFKGAAVQNGDGTMILERIANEYIHLPWARTFEVSVDYTFEGVPNCLAVPDSFRGIGEEMGPV